MNDLVSLGNSTLFQLHKTAYFCSEHFDSGAVLASYDWARQMRTEKRCVISGFQSRIETDVLEILLRGDSPVILVLARRLYSRVPQPFQSAVEKGNLLILSPFPESITRASSQTGYQRNCRILRIANEVVIGSLTPGGNLERALRETGTVYRILTHTGQEPEE